MLVYDALWSHCNSRTCETPCISYRRERVYISGPAHPSSFRDAAVHDMVQIRIEVLREEFRK